MYNSELIGYGPGPTSGFSLPEISGNYIPQNGQEIPAFTDMNWGYQAPNYSLGSPIQGNLGFNAGQSSVPGFNTGLSSPSSGSWFSGLLNKNTLLGTREQPGAIGLGLQAAAGIAGTFMGMKQYGLAKQRLQDQKDQFNMNYAAQRTTTNAQLEDRQRARVAANPNAYESVGVYMDRNRIR
jgi:hypothetical protein